MRGNWEPWYLEGPRSPSAARPTREFLSPRLLLQDQIAFRVDPSNEMASQVVRPRHGFGGLEGPSYPRPEERVGDFPCACGSVQRCPGCEIVQGA